LLDDLKYIHDRDAQDALGVAEKQWQQLQHTYEVDLSGFNDIRNIVLAGMGGSALPAVIVRSWPGTLVPFEIVRDYELPGYVNQHTLVISSSYSGNTEETLEALRAAESRGAQIAVLRPVENWRTSLGRKTILHSPSLGVSSQECARFIS
jgi:glucose/mannose-6-phosphate isomerase